MQLRFKKEKRKKKKKKAHTHAKARHARADFRQDSSAERKTRQVRRFAKRSVLRLDVNSLKRVSVGEEGKGHSIGMGRRQKRRRNQE